MGKISDDVTRALQDLRPFQATPSFYAIRGQLNIPKGESIGMLPDEWADVYRALGSNPTVTILYTVMSYDTPIAWVVERDQAKVVVIPDVKYSATTSGKQATCRHQLPYPNSRVEKIELAGDFG